MNLIINEYEEKEQEQENKTELDNLYIQKLNTMLYQQMHNIEFYYYQKNY